MRSFICVLSMLLLALASIAQVDIDENGETITLSESEAIRYAVLTESKGDKIKRDIRLVKGIIAFIERVGPEVAQSQAEIDKLIEARQTIIIMGRRLQKLYIESKVTARTIHQGTLDSAVDSAQALVTALTQMVTNAQEDFDNLPPGASQAEIDVAQAVLDTANAALTTATNSYNATVLTADTFGTSAP